jgi:hypothetical protein
MHNLVNEELRMVLWDGIINANLHPNEVANYYSNDVANYYCN